MAASAEAGEGADRPLLDMSDDAVQTMIKRARRRGFVTHGEINAVLPSHEVTSERIEDILAMLHEMGINTVEQDESESEAAGATEASADDDNDDANDSEGDLVETVRRLPAEVKKPAPGERTTDPVRQYLRDMSAAQLLSREGEVAVAKRIEAGREAMIAALCESPLSFQAIILWRDELNEGKVQLRDIIDLEATYAGPGAEPLPTLRARGDAGLRTGAGAGAAAAARRARDGARGAVRPGRTADRAGAGRGRSRWRQ